MAFVNPHVPQSFTSNICLCGIFERVTLGSLPKSCLFSSVLYFLISSKVATGTSWCLWTDWRLDVPQLVLGLSCNLPENFVPAWHQVGRQLWYQLGRHPMDVKPQFELNQQPAITGGQVLCTTGGNALTVCLIAGTKRHSFCLRAVTLLVKIRNILHYKTPLWVDGTSPWVVDFGLLQCRLFLDEGWYGADKATNDYG